MKYVVALFIALTLNAFANLMMKLGTKPVEQAGGLLRDGVIGGIRTVLGSAPLMVGLICFGLNAAFYMYALQSKALKISLAYPIMTGGGFALIAIVARYHPALSERLSWVQIVGVAMILGGIVLLASQFDRGTA